MTESALAPVLLVTGASSGIGKATAHLFAREGYRVVLAARRIDRLEELAQEIRLDGGEALPVETDVSKLDDIQRMVVESLETYGQIDVLLNNAGFGRLNWCENLDPIQDIQKQIEVNLLGLIWTTQTVLPHMKQRRMGHIINMASIASLVATPTYSIYAASKFGVRGFTDALRREVQHYGIHVSGIYPGGVRTEFAEIAGIQRKTGIKTPAFLRLEAEDVAKAIFGLVHRPRRMLVIPWTMRIGAWAASLFPGLTDWIMIRGFVKRERGG